MGTLTIALPKVDVLPPTRVTDDTSVLTLKQLVFEPLIAWERGFARPALFSHWTHDADGRRWEFFIRPDAVFHDGKPCVPQDILSVIEGVIGSVDTFGMKWSYARYLARARIAASAGRSIVVENPEPFADILDIFTEFYVPRIGPDGAATLGTGPYRIVEFASRERAVLARVDHSAPGSPKHIVLLEVASADERWRLLNVGTIDVAANLEHMEHPPAEDERFILSRQLNTQSVMFYLNCHRGPFARPEARLAANLALDKPDLVRSVFHGLAAPSSTIVSPWHLGMAGTSLRPIEHDLARARDLMERVGGPAAITLRTPTHMPERAPEISAFVAEALARIGFRVNIDTATDRPEYARQIGRKEMGDLAIFDSTPHSTYRVLDDKISSTTKAVWWQGYDDPDVERLIEAAHRAIEDGERERAYAACLHRLNAEPPWLYLVHPVVVTAARRDVAPIALNPKGTLTIGGKGARE